MIKLKSLIWCVLIPLALGGPYPNFRSHWYVTDESKDWWEVSSFYQIYPRSFKDSNGDGIGDINGITEMLPYLKEIGINATWLSPIFKSPMKDFGYDISDFYSIQEEYGTFEDFHNMITRAKELGIKIILDFVPNHSSDECEWFQKSAKRDPKYVNYYMWHSGFPDPKNASNRLPPNNWVSVFRGSAWTWNEERKQFYFHQFLDKQPDFNYRDPDVVEAMKDVLRFWMDKGVDGFRIDAVPHTFEVAPDQDGNYPNEPRSGNSNDPEDYGYLNHIFTVDQNETIDMLYQWREVLDRHQEKNGGSTRVIMAETYSPINIIMRYYGDGEREGAHIPFNFLFITNLHNGSSAHDYESTIHTWMDNMPAGRTANWVLGNHDKPRIGSRFGRDKIDLMNILLMTLPGVSVNYNGEEIGMTDVWISWNDTVDPQACNTNPNIYESFSRDPERTPFQWDDSKNAGFSTASKTWLPVAPSYKEVNVKLQRPQPHSHLNIYKKVQQLRRTKTILHGDLKTKAFNDDVLGISRSLPDEATYVTVVNIGQEPHTVDLTELNNLPDQLEFVVGSQNSHHREGDTVQAKEFTLQANEAAVLKTSSKLKHVFGYYFYNLF